MQRFEFQSDKSSKFWEVSSEGSEVTTRWGRIGSSGQTKTKDCGAFAKAEAAVDKQIRAKTGKGYFEAGGAAPGGAMASPALAKPVQISGDLGGRRTN